MTSANLAAWIAAQNGSIWLQAAKPADLSAATDHALRVLNCGPMDTRLAITCLKAIAAYQREMRGALISAPTSHMVTR